MTKIEEDSIPVKEPDSGDIKAWEKGLVIVAIKKIAECINTFFTYIKMKIQKKIDEIKEKKD